MLSGEGPYIISTRDDMESSSSLMRAEMERGSVMRSHPDSVPRDSSKIFKVIDKAQVFCPAHWSNIDFEKYLKDIKYL